MDVRMVVSVAGSIADGVLIAVCYYNIVMAGDDVGGRMYELSMAMPANTSVA